MRHYERFKDEYLCQFYALYRCPFYFTCLLWPVEIWMNESNSFLEGDCPGQGPNYVKREPASSKGKNAVMFRTDRQVDVEKDK